MRKLLRCSLLILAAAGMLAGCSESNLEAPDDVHPAAAVWYQGHQSATTAATYVDDCGGCHVVSNQPGEFFPPSCFAASFTAADGVVYQCHVNGPGAPHPMSDAFLNGGHGKLAKADLTFCQECHSNNPNGGPGSNPVFNVGIIAGPNGGGGCEQCHPAGAAHPADWAGPNADNTYHYSAGNIQAACTLCHGTNLDGATSGGVGISCLNCHAETTNFTLDCTACHGFPPDGVNGETEVLAEGGILVNHIKDPLNPDILTSSHDQCATCHGVKNNGGSLNPSVNYLAFNKTTDTLGDHWNGQINMNSQVGYDQATFGCTLACHGNDAAHQLSDSALPVALGAYGTGGAPHSVGDNWLRVSQHATAAVNGPLNCVGCHTLTGGGIDPPCQGCHQVAPIGNLTTAGCVSCHSYPPDGVTPVATQPNRAGNHGKHVSLTPDTANCGSCHQGGGTDSITHYDRIDATTPNYPAEVAFLANYNAKSGAAAYDSTAQTCATVSCHGGVPTPNWYTGTLPTTDPAISNAYCQSCHTAGTTEYNGYNSGQHTLHVAFYKCVVCHNTTTLQNGVGGVGPTHWSNLETPDIFELAPADTVGGGTTLAIYNGTSCTNSAVGCHPGETRLW